MKIGIPREIKVLEGRVALTPAAVRELVKHDHQVFVEQNAGLLSGYPDAEYSDAALASGINLKKGEIILSTLR